MAFALCFICAFTHPASASETNTNSLTLAECFQKVLAHDPELFRLRKDVERAAGTRVEFHSRDLAQLSVQPTAGLEGGKLYVHNKPYALITAQFSQPVFNMSMAANWRRGNKEVLATEQNLNAGIANRLHAARIYYIRAQRLHELIALYEELDQRLQANVKSEHERGETGHSGPRPELQARVQWLAERAELTEFRREDFEVRADLAEMMNAPLDPPPDAAESFTNAPAQIDFQAQTELARQKRPDIQFLRALISMAGEDKRIAQAGYFPFVSLIGSSLYIPGRQPVYQATPIIEGQQPLGTDVRGGGSLSWQIVDDGSVTGERRRIEAVREQYEIVLRQLEEDIPRELQRVALSLDTADARLKALEKSTAEAGEGLRLTENRIGLGEATQLDFSDAHRNLLAVRHAIVDAQFQRALALAELDRATGRYLEFAEPVKQP